MKRLFGGLLILTMIFAATESYAMLIDDFTYDFSLQADQCGSGYDSIMGTGDMIGGMSYLVLATASDLCQDGSTAAVDVSGNLFSYVSDEGMNASLRITWAQCWTTAEYDQEGNMIHPQGCDYSSLGGINLTENSADSIRIRVMSGGDSMAVTVYSDADHCSTAMLNVPDVTSPADFYLPFNSFTPAIDCPAGLADFTNVGAISLAFMMGGGRNIVIDRIETAVFEPPTPPNAEEQIEDTQEFFDDAVSSGELTGTGPTSTAAAGKLNAIENMLEQAEYLIDNGFIEEACNQLNAIYKKTDGKAKPKDFVTGAAAEDLAEKILALMDSLGCE